MRIIIKYSYVNHSGLPFGVVFVCIKPNSEEKYISHVLHVMPHFFTFVQVYN